ncbi:MAG: radical SAM protein [Chitinispirillales bacterium]|jgi:7-carboxy-7-deazaguanine synthase|nr:radical SAM protein [Chitinispirillales bacterium]
MINVSEIFLSIQGESTQSGRPCSFVRLFGCNLRCVWCDTKYARGDCADTVGGPSPMPLPVVIAAVDKLYANVDADTAVGAVNTPPVPRLVEITGGEPLLQPETAALCAGFLALGYEVMLETNGSLDIAALPPGVRRVVDVKCPGSGEGGSFLAANINHIGPGDELKFVLASIDDAVWAAEFCARRGLAARCPIIFSPSAPSLPYKTLAEWMVKTRPAGVRLGIQLHKVIWGDSSIGR